VELILFLHPIEKRTRSVVEEKRTKSVIMKKLLILMFVMMAGVAIAQPSAVVNGYNALKEGKLDKAKEYFDAAVLHPKTSVKEKTWRYRGDAYYEIMASQNEEYMTLHENPGMVAYDSYQKAAELGSKYGQEMSKKFPVIQNALLNKGVEDFNGKAYAKAITKFKGSVTIAEHRGLVDTLALFNVALAAERGENYDEAIEYYNKCKAIDYRAGDVCGFIIGLYQKQGKDEEALKEVKACRAAFPDDQNMIIMELNYYLKEGDFEGAKANLDAAIKNDPENHVLHFSVGTVLDNMGKITEAEKSYLGALAIKADYFDANYNLGALYFNDAVQINNKANDELDNKKAKAIQDEASAVFQKAMPYLEKARELKPEDRNTLKSLQSLYARVGETEKYNEVKAALEN
jgi:tetratricopeptide (TPR) repeat protein